MSDIIRVVAGAILSNGRVLAAQRADNSDQGGLWELPGGKVETAESDHAALIRELQEELGVTVVVTDFLAESVHAYPNKTIHLVAFRCKISSGIPTAREHNALRWLGIDELERVSWAPADQPFLPALARCLNKSAH